MKQAYKPTTTTLHAQTHAAAACNAGALSTSLLSAASATASPSLLSLPSPPCGCQASSVKNNEDEYHPDNVTTDDRDETWHAGKTAPAHIDLDLGSSAMIEHLDLLPYQASSAQGDAHHDPQLLQRTVKARGRAGYPLLIP